MAFLGTKHFPRQPGTCSIIVVWHFTHQPIGEGWLLPPLKPHSRRNASVSRVAPQMPVNIGLCLTAIWKKKKSVCVGWGGGISAKDYMGLFRGEHIDFPDKKALYYSDLSQGKLWQRQQAHLSAWVARARRLVERLSEREESLFTAAMTRQPCWAGNARPWTLLLLTRTKRTSQPQTVCQCDKYGFTAQKFTRGHSAFKQERQRIWDREVKQSRALMKACSDWVTNVSCLSDITACRGCLKYPAHIHLGIKINTN